MKIKIHRGAKEVGGSCVEISSDASTILVDLGLPLDFNGENTTESCLPNPDGHPKYPTCGHFKIPHLNSFKM